MHPEFPPFRPTHYTDKIEPMNRRDFLNSSAAIATGSLLTGCTPKKMIQTPPAPAPTLPLYDAVPPLAPIRAHEDRLFKITVCLRPFRAAGPRIESERIGDKLIVHNYGHGGSGWSLSWGSGEIAIAQALAGRDPSLLDAAVIGAGALGLTSAILLQRAGCRSVTIYAKDHPSDTRSFKATGSWTPDSRVALTKSVSPAFAQQWEQMARTSWRTYQRYLGLPGNPIEFSDRYALSDAPPENDLQRRRNEDPIGFAHYMPLIQDISPTSIDLPPGTHPFPTRFARRNSQMMFNITGYVHQLIEDFLLAGGKIVTREFHSPTELARAPPARHPPLAPATEPARSSPITPSPRSAARSAGSSPSPRSTTAYTSTISTSSPAATASSSSSPSKAKPPAGTPPTNPPTAAKPKRASASSATSTPACTLLRPERLSCARLKLCQWKKNRRFRLT